MLLLHIFVIIKDVSVMNKYKILNNNIVIISVDNMEQGHFFLRWEKALNEMGYTVIYVTYTYSLYKLVNRRIDDGNYVEFLTNKNVKEKNNSSIEDKILYSIEYNAGWNDTKELSNLYYAIKQKYESSYINLNVEYIVLWNGNKISDISWKDLADEYNIKTLYIELANMEGKIFVDPIGTNAKSYLYDNNSVLKKFNYEELDYKLWKEIYIRSKYKQKTVKQARKRGFIDAVRSNLLDLYGAFVKNGAYRKHINKKKVLDRFYRQNFSYRKLNGDEKYIFFPLQVTTDTQILINGNMSLLDSLRYAIKKAEDEDCWLIIKPHPAEKNPANIKEIERIASVYKKCIFSNRNTFELLENAFKVITINSTVGIEAMILDCKLDIIGRAFYQNFKNDDLQRYIMGYLVNVDFWGTQNLTQVQMKEILSRAEING